MHRATWYKFLVVIKDNVQGSQTVMVLYVELFIKTLF